LSIFLTTSSTRKKARLFGLIPIREKVRTQMDPETGEITRIKNPW